MLDTAALELKADPFASAYSNSKNVRIMPDAILSVPSQRHRCSCTPNQHTVLVAGLIDYI